MNHQTDIDNLIKKMVREDGLETPSNGFTDEVMHTIMELDVKPVPYKPLVPKYVFAAIFSGVVILVLFLFSGELKTGGNNSSYLDKIVNGFQVFNFDLSIPAHLSYIVTSALIMLMIQVVLIGTIYKRIHR